MQVQLVVGLAVTVGPTAAAFHNHGCRSKYAFEDFVGFKRPRVAFDTQRQSLGEVPFARGSCRQRSRSADKKPPALGIARRGVRRLRRRRRRSQAPRLARRC